MGDNQFVTGIGQTGYSLTSFFLSLKLTTFFFTTHGASNIADPTRMSNEPSNYDLACLVKAPDWSTWGHGFYCGDWDLFVLCLWQTDYLMNLLNFYFTWTIRWRYWSTLRWAQSNSVCAWNTALSVYTYVITMECCDCI